VKIKRVLYLVVFLCTVEIFFGCKPSEDTGSTMRYFKLDSLIQEQMTTVLSRKVYLEKISLLDGKYDSSGFIPDSIHLAREFAVIEQNSIDKPKYWGLYEKEFGKDNQSNLNTLTYHSTRELPVPYLKIYYLNTINNLRKIETAYVDKNSIYHSFREIKILFEDVNEEVVIKEYHIQGYQKMLGVDTVKYKVTGRLNFE